MPTRLHVTLSPNEGMVEVKDYCTGSLSSRNNLLQESIQEGTDGTPILKSERTYEKREIGSFVAWNLSSLTQYEDEANQNPIVTHYAYTYHPNSLQIEERITTYPAIPANQNGTNTSATRIDRYDTNGRLVWSKDELGIISYRQYNTITGLLVKNIQDVNTMQAADFTNPVPAGWITISGAGKHLITEYAYDIQKRVIQTLGPRNTAVDESNQPIEVRSVSWTIYDDAHFTVKSASGYATLSGNTITGYTLVNPVSITIRDTSGKVLEQIRASRVSASGKLLASDVFPQTSYTAWTKNLYQGGKLTATRQYHLLKK